MDVSESLRGPCMSSAPARRVSTLFRHLQPHPFVAASNSGIGITVAPVYGVLPGAEALPSLLFDGEKELLDPRSVREEERETSQNEIGPFNVRITKREGSKTEPFIDSNLSDALGWIQRATTTAGKIGDPSPGIGGVDEPQRDKVILVVGAGDATGGAVAKRFAREGYVACVVRRHADKLKNLLDEIIADGGQAHSFGVDARKEEEMVALVDHIERNIGKIHVVVFNIGANVQFSILETTARVYSKVWEMACFAGFLTGREAAKRMVSRNQGTIIFTGATASVRGSSGFAAFAGAKFALRALAQSMARELGPKGIHIAHVIIDAKIDSAFNRERFAESDSWVKDDSVVQPVDIAEVYWQLHQQPRRAWTHEVDLRPYKEPW